MSRHRRPVKIQIIVTDEEGVRRCFDFPMTGVDSYALDMRHRLDGASYDARWVHETTLQISQLSLSPNDVLMRITEEHP